MATSKSRTFIQSLSESQIQSLALPVGSKILIEIATPANEVSPVPIKIGDKVGFESIPSIEFGYLTVTNDGYTLRIDSGGEEITEAYEYLQGRVNEGCRVKFALPSDNPTWYYWKSIDWKPQANGNLAISLN
jgi:hypothetical protein